MMLFLRGIQMHTTMCKMTGNNNRKIGVWMQTPARLFQQFAVYPKRGKAKKDQNAHV